MFKPKKKIMIFGFGGTLAMLPGPSGLRPAKTVGEILDLVPSLRQMADLSYEAGQMALDVGAIPAGDMTDVAAQVKLMWILAQGGRSHDELERLLNTDFVGEITP